MAQESKSVTSNSKLRVRSSKAPPRGSIRPSQAAIIKAVSRETRDRRDEDAENAGDDKHP